jgi:hypothetical protein
VARSGVYRPRKPANDNDAADALDRLSGHRLALLGWRCMTAVVRAEGAFVSACSG